MPDDRELNFGNIPRTDQPRKLNFGSIPFMEPESPYDDSALGAAKRIGGSLVEYGAALPTGLQTTISAVNQLIGRPIQRLAGAFDPELEKGLRASEAQGFETARKIRESAKQFSEKTLGAKPGTPITIENLKKESLAGKIGMLARGTVESVPATLVNLGMTLLNPAVGTASIYLAETGGTRANLDELEKSGVKIDPAYKDIASVGGGALKTALEQTGLESLVSKAPGARSKVFNILSSLLTEFKTEGVQELADVLTEAGAKVSGGDSLKVFETFKSEIENNLPRLEEASIRGGLAGGAIRGGVEALRIPGERTQAKKAEQEKSIQTAEEEARLAEGAKTARENLKVQSERESLLDRLQKERDLEVGGPLVGAEEQGFRRPEVIDQDIQKRLSEIPEEQIPSDPTLRKLLDEKKLIIQAGEFDLADFKPAGAPVEKPFVPVSESRKGGTEEYLGKNKASAVADAKSFNSALDDFLKIENETKGKPLSEQMSVAKQRLEEKGYHPAIVDELANPERLKRPDLEGDLVEATTREGRIKRAVEPPPELKPRVDNVAKRTKQFRDAEADYLQARKDIFAEVEKLGGKIIAQGEDGTFKIEIKPGKAKLSLQDQLALAKLRQEAAEAGAYSLATVGKGFEIAAAPLRIKSGETLKGDLNQKVSEFISRKNAFQGAKKGADAAKKTLLDSYTDFYFKNKVEGKPNASLIGRVDDIPVEVQLRRKASSPVPDTAVIDPTTGKTWAERLRDERKEAQKRSEALGPQGEPFVEGRPIGAARAEAEKAAGTPFFIISDQAYQQAKANLDRLTKESLSSTQMGGLQNAPQIFKEMVIIGSYHFERGIRKFDEWLAEMLKTTGLKVIENAQKLFEIAKRSSELRESKVRDESGALKPVYHGTSQAFTDFDPTKLSEKSLYGKGYYFTDSPTVASSYTQKGVEGKTQFSMPGDQNKVLRSEAFYTAKELEKRNQKIGQSDLGKEILTLLHDDNGELLPDNTLIEGARVANAVYGAAVVGVASQKNAWIVDQFNRRLPDTSKLNQVEVGFEFNNLLSRLGFEGLDGKFNFTLPESSGNVRPAFINVKNPLDLSAQFVSPQLFVELKRKAEVFGDPALISKFHDSQNRVRAAEVEAAAKALEQEFPYYLPETLGHMERKDIIKARAARLNISTEIFEKRADDFKFSPEQERRYNNLYEKSRKRPPSSQHQTIAPGDPIKKVFDLLGAENIKALGYDGIRYRGGKAIGGLGEHDAWVVFDKDQIVSLFESLKEPVRSVKQALSSVFEITKHLSESEVVALNASKERLDIASREFAGKLYSGPAFSSQIWKEYVEIGHLVAKGLARNLGEKAKITFENFKEAFKNAVGPDLFKRLESHLAHLWEQVKALPDDWKSGDEVPGVARAEAVENTPESSPSNVAKARFDFGLPLLDRLERSNPVGEETSSKWRKAHGILKTALGRNAVEIRKIAKEAGVRRDKTTPHLDVVSRQLGWEKKGANLLLVDLINHPERIKDYPLTEVEKKIISLYRSTYERNEKEIARRLGREPNPLKFQPTLNNEAREAIFVLKGGPLFEAMAKATAERSGLELKKVKQKFASGNLSGLDIPTHVPLKGNLIAVGSADAISALQAQNFEFARTLGLLRAFGPKWKNEIKHLREKYDQAGGDLEIFDLIEQGYRGLRPKDWISEKQSSRNLAARLYFRAVDPIFSSLALSKSAWTQITQPFIDLQNVGVKNFMKTITEGFGGKLSADDLERMGIISRDVLNWKFAEGEKIEDYGRMISALTNRGDLMYAASLLNDVVSASNWRNFVNSLEGKKLTAKDRQTLRTNLGLTEAEIQKVEQGKFKDPLGENPATPEEEFFVEMVRRGKTQSQHTGKFGGEKSKFQTGSTSPFFLRFQNYTIGEFQRWRRETANLERALKSGGKSERNAAIARVLKLVGTTAVQSELLNIIRHTIKGEWDETEEGSAVGQALKGDYAQATKNFLWNFAEAGFMGAFTRAYLAYQIAQGSATALMDAFFPTNFVHQLWDALGERGRYADKTWDEKIGQFFEDRIPASDLPRAGKRALALLDLAKEDGHKTDAATRAYFKWLEDTNRGKNYEKEPGYIESRRNFLLAYRALNSGDDEEVMPLLIKGFDAKILENERMTPKEALGRLKASLGARMRVLKKDKGRLVSRFDKKTTEDLKQEIGEEKYDLLVAHDTRLNRLLESLYITNKHLVRRK